MSFLPVKLISFIKIMKNSKFTPFFGKKVIFPLLALTIIVNTFQVMPSQTNVSENSNQPPKTNSNVTVFENQSSDKEERVIKQITSEWVEICSGEDCPTDEMAEASRFSTFALFAIGGGALTPIIINNLTNNSPVGPTGVISPTQP